MEIHQSSVLTEKRKRMKVKIYPDGVKVDTSMILTCKSGRIVEFPNGVPADVLPAQLAFPLF